MNKSLNIIISHLLIMRYLINKYLFLILIIILLFSYNNLIISSLQGSISSNSIEFLPFKQEITIPIDTSQDQTKYQPIDMRINFHQPCFAQNETIHSVRVGYDDGIDLTEIESQIYDFEFTNHSIIKACSLVFLVPKEATGKEKYYVYYSNTQTSNVNYTDHLIVDDEHFYYEPIQGQTIDFDYYKITEDGTNVYGLSYEGSLFGHGISQVVARLTPNATEFETNNLDQFASFAMLYSTDNKQRDYSGTSLAKNPSTSILVDGNLMVKIQIEGNSNEGTIKTSNIYTYYYNPNDTKRISVSVHHEVLETCVVSGSKALDGTYSYLLSFKSRSSAIENFNIGSILPSLYLYDKDNIIQNYFIPKNPSSENEEMVLATIDDVDLGHKAWLCIENPTTKKTHGLIFQSPIVITNEEEDGIQIKSFVQQTLKLPGLEIDTGSVYATRNHYNRGKETNFILNKGLNVTFNVEFITFQKGGYEAVDAESEIYQKLVGSRPIYRGNISDGKEEEKQRYSITAYLHRAQAIPMGSLLSATLGKNISYISAELYKDDSFASSGSAGRLPIGSIDLDFENKNLVQKIKLAFGIFDWRNLSFFKKIRFPDLEAGRYLIKVYKENPLFGNERQYIGFSIVDLNEETTVDIHCRSEGTAELSIMDQNEEGIENVKFLLLSGGTVISSMISDINGNVVLKAPCYRKDLYILKVIYQGFLVDEKEISFGLKNSFTSYKDTFFTSLYQLKLKLKDTLGLTLAVDVNPMLTSSEMIDQNIISGDEQGNGGYLFTDLYSADYVLKISYKSFVSEIKVSVRNDKTLELEFPAEFTVDFNCMNSYGAMIEDGEISLDREGKGSSISITSSGKACVIVPPGIYDIRITSNDKEIARQDIVINGNKELDIVTSQGSFLHAIVTYLGALLAVFSIALIAWKRKTFEGLKLLAIALIIIALVSPWWVLTGDNETISTTTNTFLVPSKIITLTSSNSVFGGEISSVPSEFTMVLELITILLVIDCLFVFIGIFIKYKYRKISTVLSIIGVLLLIISLLVFYIAMSEVTSVGVGGFTGFSDLSISPLSLSFNTLVSCSWGPGIGFYLIILVTIISIFNFFKHLIKF